MTQTQIGFSAGQQGSSGSMGLLPFMPLNPAWLEHSSAFIHPDPLVFKAALRLLFAAWRGAPAGAIPSSHAFLASATAMDITFVSKNYVAMTEGFELREDGLLHHVQLSKICREMRENYAKEIDAYALSVAMSTQDPANLGLVNTEAAGRKIPRGKSALPRGFGYDSIADDLRGWCLTHGYPTLEDQQYIMEKFIDYAKSRDERNKDWSAAFRTWATNEISFRRFPPSYVASAPPTKSSAFSSLTRNSVLSKGDAIAARNLERMSSFDQRPRGGV